MIIFVGPLPPPIHGFSTINQRMVEALRARTEVVVLNTAKRIGGGRWFPPRLSRIMQWPSYLIQLVVLCASKPTPTLYLGLSGGLAQVFDTVFLHIARAFDAKTVVHHHSFAYINRKTWLSRHCMHAARAAEHIVLCEEMGRGLERMYSIRSSHILLLSNAAFIEVPPLDPRPEAVHEKSLCIGFLSSVSEEKGIFDFVSSIRKGKDLGLPVRGLIAGPLDPKIESYFREAIRGLPIEYKGSVYGSAKDEFLRSVDLLLFPSRYVNEAEPLVILEALSYSVFVVANSRGCIDTLIGDSGGGVVVMEGEDFVGKATEQILRLFKSPGARELLRSAARDRFIKLTGENRGRFYALIGKMASGNPI